MSELTHFIIYSHISKKYLLVNLAWEDVLVFNDPVNCLLLKSFTNNKPVHFLTSKEALDYEYP